MGGAEGGDLGGGVVDIEGDLGNDEVSYAQDDATGNVSAVLDGDPGTDIVHVLGVGNVPTLKSFNAVDQAVLDPDCLDLEA